VKHKAQESTHKKKKKKKSASRWIHEQACTRNIYAHWICAIQNITTLQHSTSTCRGRSCLKNKQTKRTNITRASIQLFRLSAQWQNSSMLEIPMKEARAVHHRSILLIGISTCAGRACYKKNKKNIIVERAQDNIFVCTRDQLAEKSPVRRRQSQTTRNAFSFLLERPTRRSSQRDHMCSAIFCSYLHRHSPRRSSDHSRMANLLERRLADDVSCSRDHSQNVLAAVRVVVLHNHVFCFPIALSARATTRRRRLLEKLADRSSQTGACGRQHYDNDNSQYKPRDFGWKLRGARRISRE
jgi:hypothetical protein